MTLGGRFPELVHLGEPVGHLGQVEHLAGRRLRALAGVPEAELQPAAVSHPRELKLAQAGEAGTEGPDERGAAPGQRGGVLRVCAKAGKFEHIHTWLMPDPLRQKPNLALIE